MIDFSPHILKIFYSKLFDMTQDFGLRKFRLVLQVFLFEECAPSSLFSVSNLKVIYLSETLDISCIDSISELMKLELFQDSRIILPRISDDNLKQW